MRKIDTIVIHCTATPEGMTYPLESLRADHHKRGFVDVGYHYYIRKDGTIQEGRPIQKAGAHAQGYNAHSIGVCYEGGLDSDRKPKDTRTDSQKKSLSIIIKSLLKQYPEIRRIVGHRDLPDVKKDCPCFDAIEEYKNLLP